MRASIGSRCFEIPRGVLSAIASGVLTFQVVTAARLAAQETAVPAPAAVAGDNGNSLGCSSNQAIAVPGLHRAAASPADAAQFKRDKCSQMRQPNARCVDGNADARGARNPRYFGEFASAGLSAAGD